MPKMKTHKGAKKRTKVSGTGKIMRKKANASHLLSKKSGKRKRSLQGNHALSGGDEKSLKKALRII